MARVVWSKRGLDDFHEQLSFVEKSSLEQAKRIAKIIVEKVDMLQEFPKMGRIVPEFAQKEIRELIVYQYRVVYRMKRPDTVEVISIYHSKQLLS